jgi:ribosomal protein S18 acetylase RimI-like enzyme/mannose-6-phosphate isomerase-like protein (cupin superfamily)
VHSLKIYYSCSQALYKCIRGQIASSSGAVSPIGSLERGPCMASHSRSSEPTPDEHDAIVDLIVREQARPDRNVPSLGVDRVGVMAELADLSPPWAETVRVVRDADSNPIGAIFVDWSTEAGRAWIHGPWIEVDDGEWQGRANELLEAALAQPPSIVTSRVLSADVYHHGLARLASQRGWRPSRIDYVLVIEKSTVDGWTSAIAPTMLRPMRAADLTSLKQLHDREFPSTYFSASELGERAERGEHVVLIAPDTNDDVAGYLAARIQPDGEGFIDYLAVSQQAQRRGIGRDLVIAATHQIVPLSTTGRVCLTVREDRVAARDLYASLGFTVEAEMVGYVLDDLASGDTGPMTQFSIDAEPRNLNDLLNSFEQRWSPRIVTQVNDYDVRVAKVEGTYIWHRHDNTDEFFMVLDGVLDIGIRESGAERTVTLHPHDVFVVPMGTEHRPASADGASILLFEMSGTLTTGTTDEAIPDYVDSTTGHQLA